jgi:hypothetical protein
VRVDAHKLSTVGATLRPPGDSRSSIGIETTERAIRRFDERLGGPNGLAVCCDAGPGGFDLLRLLQRTFRLDYGRRA